MSNYEDKDRKFQRKVRHLEELKALGFTGSFAELQALEKRYNQLATKSCNGTISEDAYEKQTTRIEEKVRAMFPADLPIYFNGDPRGYGLKLDDKFMRSLTTTPLSQSDWGGYGILAPADEDF